MGDRLRNFLSLGVFLGALFSLAASAQGSKEFSDTNGGNIQEDTDRFNGIDANEAITKKGQEILNRFRDGRKSSNVNQTSRYSKILEHHDEDFDGVTDHQGAANALEGGMESVALKGKKLRGTEREKELEKAREDEAYKQCVKNAKPDGEVSVEAVCGNPSSILVNKGAAHGDDKKDPHRVYELTKEAQEKAKEAGKAYGDRAVSEAGEWGDDPTPLGTQGIKDADGRIRSMRVANRKTGGSDVVALAPDIDLLKSEYSYLEQLKEYQTNLEWKSLRAARLAGAESDKGTIMQFAGIWGKKGLTEQQKEQEVAQRIYEMQIIGGEYVCVDKNKSNVKVQPDDGKCPTAVPEEITLNEAYEHVALRGQLDAIRQQLRAKANKNQSAQAKKAQKQDVGEIKNCLGRDVWCPGPGNVARAQAQARKGAGGGATNNGRDVADKAASKVEAYKPIQGDPGATYLDTREYTMNRLSAANAGGLDNFMKTMSNADFSEGTDRKTDTKPFAQMKKEWEEAKRAAEIVQGKQKDAERQRAFQNPNYRNPYEGQQFNTQNMNTVQLFGRRRGRDGMTFQVEGMPGPGGMPAPGSPAPPPRRRAPTAAGAPTALPQRR